MTVFLPGKGWLEIAVEEYPTFLKSMGFTDEEINAKLEKISEQKTQEISEILGDDSVQSVEVDVGQIIDGKKQDTTVEVVSKEEEVKE